MTILRLNDALAFTDIFLQIYSELCVLSHYQEVKAGRGRPEHYARNSVRFHVIHCSEYHKHSSVWILQGTSLQSLSSPSFLR